MARPTHTTIISGEENWESDVNDNLGLIFTTPVPLGEYATASLPTANSYDRCLAVDTDKNRLVYSTSTEWRDIEMRRRVVVTKTSTYTATDDDDVILCDATSGVFTIDLPTAVGRSGKSYVIKKIDSTANAITVDGDSGETIDGATTSSLSSQWDYLTIVSDGTNWMEIT